MQPQVSIILPTYNRARFLPAAFASIRAQAWPRTQLVVVDDGSTDDTSAIVEQEARSLPLTYVHRPNGGAYAARNTGLDHATGDYIAFYDSDDVWLPGYLNRTITALEANDDVDWVYAACRMVDEATGETRAPSTFYAGGQPRPFLRLPASAAGPLRILEAGPALRTQLESGLYAGLQNSVIRRRVFDGERFWPDYRVVEDVLFLVRALARGLRIGYLDEALVVYRMHDDNSSASVVGGSASRLLPIFEEEVRGLERLRAEVPLPADAAAILARELGKKYFWRLGYAGYWSVGRRDNALHAFRTGLALRRYDWRMWKTYGLCRLRAALAP